MRGDHHLLRRHHLLVVRQPDHARDGAGLERGLVDGREAARVGPDEVGTDVGRGGGTVAR